MVRELTGIVRDGLEIRIGLPIHFPYGWTTVEAVIDTGYDESLTLPASLAAGLPKVDTTRAILADGTERLLDVVSVEIEWDGERILIDALVTGAFPLIGTLLLEGRRLTADFIPDGPVAIVPLDASQ